MRQILVLTGAAVLVLVLLSGTHIPASSSAILFDSLPSSAGTTNDAPGRDGRPNIVIIDIDRLNSDHLPCYGYHRNTTPNICRFGERNLLFQNAISQSGWTAGSIASLFTGQHPGVHGVTDHQSSLPPDAITMAEYLKEHDYTTVAFVPRTPNVSDADISPALLAPRYNLDQGFDQYTGTQTHLDPQEIGRHMTNLSEPLFLYMQDFRMHAYNSFIDGHIPPNHAEMYRQDYTETLWQLPLAAEPTDIILSNGSYRLPLENGTTIRVPDEAIDYAIDRYDAHLKKTDHAVQDILDTLREEGIYDNSIIIITGNHGEVLGRETWAYTEVFKHGSVTESDINQPLLLRTPQKDQGRYTTPLGFIDIFPTLLDEAGIPISPGLDRRTQGTSFRPLYSGEKYETRYQFSRAFNSPQIAVRGPTWKFVSKPGSSGRLFDIVNDPEETTDVSRLHPQISESLQQNISLYRRRNSVLRERLYGSS